MSCQCSVIIISNSIDKILVVDKIFEGLLFLELARFIKKSLEWYFNFMNGLEK